MGAKKHVCVPCSESNFKSLDLEVLLVHRFRIELPRSSLYVKVSGSMGQGKGHRSKEACLCILYQDGLPSTERQSCITND